jgi:cytochrome b561
MRENTEERWGSVQIGLHWTIAALVLLVQVPAGVTMVAVEPGTVQNVCYNIHKTNGIVIFLLALVRLGWRWSHPMPVLPADMPEWQAKLARTTHALLYLVLFLMPITGFLYTAMGGFPVPFFMVYDLAQLVPENKPVAEVFKYAHLTLQFVLYLTVLLHVSGALYHHFGRRDGVLLRMLSSTKPLPGLRQGALDKRPGERFYDRPAQPGARK